MQSKGKRANVAGSKEKIKRQTSKQAEFKIKTEAGREKRKARQRISVVHSEIWVAGKESKRVGTKKKQRRKEQKEREGRHCKDGKGV